MYVPLPQTPINAKCLLDTDIRLACMSSRQRCPAETKAEALAPQAPHSKDRAQRPGRDAKAAPGEDQALVSSVLQKVLGDDFTGLDPDTARSNGSASDSAVRRWWARSSHPLLCPLTGFPITLLPYPPFKLRSDPRKPNPYKLVDGKYLAMALIVNCDVPACGRKLQVSDLHALDLHIHRCKLGPFKPTRLLQLQLAAASAPSPDARLAAAKEVVRYCNEARAELGKLRKIQESRLMQMLHGKPTKSCPLECGGRRPAGHQLLSLAETNLAKADCS